MFFDNLYKPMYYTSSNEVGCVSKHFFRDYGKIKSIEMKKSLSYQKKRLFLTDYSLQDITYRLPQRVQGLP
ncbi:hypothetical protein HID58_066224 [Brassica napus]|uniref:Uncharacterized protein n=1 Tax=Brassica napus TaxID=3708 RepID=A0ABQ7ZFH6_BRANA|nr:hypothetical protein HID58_066224 [Brassica napus]